MNRPSLLAVLLVAMIVSTGCGRNDPPPITVSTPDPVEPVVAPPERRQMSALGAATRPPDDPIAAVVDPSFLEAGVLPQHLQSVEGYVHPFMTSQLRIFIRENNRMPESFAEFANARMDSVPFPPDGMEYVIDYQNRQVKVVRSNR
jgi:hypothetical protein